LCGGLSSRMGQDKALLLLQGEPMAVRVARAQAAAGAEEVVAVGGDPVGLSAAGLAWLADDSPGEGPLGGVLTSLRHLPYDIVLVASCDLVSPAAEALAATVAALRDEPSADLAVPVQGETEQWLHAAWRHRALDALAAQFAAGERAVHRAVEMAGLVAVAVASLDAAALLDVDVPDDLLRNPGASPVPHFEERPPRRSDP
jgi:molybdopterin-guanine dinucleotide biosynthesis protein A